MKKFEYMTVLVENQKDADEAMVQFNELGRNGWQLVWIVSDKSCPNARLWFMREMKDEAVPSDPAK